MKQEENRKAVKAFSNQSVIFDAFYSPSPIIQYKRRRVRRLLSQYLQEKSSLLELNSGTGEDVLWLASQGHTVLSTDISAGMLDAQKAKISKSNYSEQIKTKSLSFLDLNKLEGSYDAIFSNFGGLNCTPHLDIVLKECDRLLKPNGILCLTIMPSNCLWEWLFALKLDFKLAFRRKKKGGTLAHIEGEYFQTHYYSPSYIQKQLPHFQTEALEALCLAVPPEFLRDRFLPYPRILKRLIQLEERIKSAFLLRSMGDYFILVLRKKQ